MAEKGREGNTGINTNTIAPKSAEQAMLIKQDAIIDGMAVIKDALIAIRDAASLGDAQTALGNLDLDSIGLEKVELKN